MTTKINPSEISSIIKKKIDGYKGAATEANVGEVLTTADGIVQIFGLEDAMYGELLDFGEGTFGLALNLESDSVGAVVLGDAGHIKEGQKVKTTGRVLDVPVGPGLKGRVIDALGRPIDGKGEIKSDLNSPIEVVAPGVIDRKSVDQPVQTGIKSIDVMVPIGRGQRGTNNWRQANRKNSNCYRYHYQTKRFGHYLSLRSDRTETINSSNCC